VDCLGFNYLDIDVGLDTQASTTSAPATVSLTEGDDTNASSAIVAFTGGTAVSTSVGFVIPKSVTSIGASIGFKVDLLKRKRYIKLAVTPGDAAQIIWAHYRLSRAQEVPNTDAERGLTKSVIG
jgi:hypothetical protein